MWSRSEAQLPLTNLKLHCSICSQQRWTSVICITQASLHYPHTSMSLGWPWTWFTSFPSLDHFYKVPNLGDVLTNLSSHHHQSFCCFQHINLEDKCSLAAHHPLMKRFYSNKPVFTLSVGDYNIMAKCCMASLSSDQWGFICIDMFKKHLYQSCPTINWITAQTLLWAIPLQHKPCSLKD